MWLPQQQQQRPLHVRRSKPMRRQRRFRTYLRWVGSAVLTVAVVCASMTIWQINTPSLSLRQTHDSDARFQVLDRYGTPLGIAYQNRLNTSAILPLHAIPEMLWRAIITAEDKHFFSHHGVDWRARSNAIWQNIRAGHAVRGASTITEQVVRILHPRPRTLWSRWLEGCEAMLLERHASKGQILEFYLNQVPYASNRRGVAQAARYYFDRNVDTLTHQEMLALAVLPRAPSALDLYKDRHTITGAMTRLSASMVQRGELSYTEHKQLLIRPLHLHPPSPPLSATHFINYIRETVPYHISDHGVLRTTLDGTLQAKVQDLLDARVQTLSAKRVRNGAVLVVDHTTRDILAWAVAGAGQRGKQTLTQGSAIDMVRMPRQPGSSLKPFLYALALDKGWSPATELNDAPMAEAIGSGLHDFHNYSHTFYGKISLREALGNSLNIPALQTISFVTPKHYLNTLHALGFESLTQPAEFYNDGLALGNGEVSLFEMVQAYTALANKGMPRLLSAVTESSQLRTQPQHVYSPEAASLIAHILSDPFARRHEFGAGSVLNLPIQTAVKTGTSTDYRDAWVMGFDARYVVGIWIGNVDQTPMDGVTGSTGPALVLRSIFAHLNQNSSPTPLYLSPKLLQKDICADGSDRSTTPHCFSRTEYFIAETQPKTAVQPSDLVHHPLTLVRPSEGLHMAYDPRIPASAQAFEFVADTQNALHQVRWTLNNTLLATTQNGRYVWQVVRGNYTLTAEELDKNAQILSRDTVRFIVK